MFLQCLECFSTSPEPAEAGAKWNCGGWPALFTHGSSLHSQFMDAPWATSWGTLVIFVYVSRTVCGWIWQFGSSSHCLTDNGMIQFYLRHFELNFFGRWKMQNIRQFASKLCEGFGMTFGSSLNNHPAHGASSFRVCKLSSSSGACALICNVM